VTQRTAIENRGERLALWAVLISALLLRLWHLGARSVWTDEGTAWRAASSPLTQLIHLCAAEDASPPLFYLFTSAALRFGDDEAHLRLVSVLASLGMVWLTYRLTRLFASRPTAALAAAFTAVSPYQIMYAQEARTYMLVSCLLNLSLYLFARAVVMGRSRAYPPFVIASALALYTQSIAVLGVLVQAAFVVLDPRARRNVWKWVAAQGASVLLFAPWIPIQLQQAGRLSESHWYLAAPGGHGVFQVMRAVLLSPVPVRTGANGVSGLGAFLPGPVGMAALVAVVVAPLAIAAVGMVARGAGGPAARLTALALVLPPAAVLAFSAIEPLWLPRYFVFLTPPLSALLAYGLGFVKPPGLRGIWAALLLYISLYGWHRYDHDYTKEPWRDVAAHIAAVSAPGRAAALVTFDLDPYDYYNRRQKAPVAAFEVSHPDVPFSTRYTPRQLEELTDAARRDVAPFDDVWVVVRSANSESRREVARRAEAVAAEGRTLEGREVWDSMTGPLRVARYGRARPDSAAAHR
jgi:mannosyltransferase